MATYRIEPPVDSEPDDARGSLGPPFAGSDASVDDILDSAAMNPPREGDSVAAFGSSAPR